MLLLLLALGFAGLITGLVLLYVRSRRHPLEPGERPPLATILCLWEFITAVIGLVAQIVIIYYRNAALHLWVRSIRPAFSYADALTGFIYLLGIAAGIELWRMKRTAFSLFSIKYAVSAAWIVVSDAHTGSRPIEYVHARYIVQFILVGLYLAILWYVNKITSKALMRADPALL